MWNSWCLTYSIVFILQNIWIQLFIPSCFWLSSHLACFSISLHTLLLCHVSIFILHCFLLHASMHITFPLLFLDLSSVHNYMFVIGGYATTISSGVSGMMLAHHLLIYFLWSQYISSFHMLFLTENYGPSTFPTKDRLAVRAKCSPASSGVKTVLPNPRFTVRYVLVKSSAISLFLSTSLRQTSCFNKHAFHWGHKISAPVANSFSVFYKDYK